MLNALELVMLEQVNIDLSNKRSETGALHSVLKVAIRARVMLTTNIDVSDDLANMVLEVK